MQIRIEINHEELEKLVLDKMFFVLKDEKKFNLKVHFEWDGSYDKMLAPKAIVTGEQAHE